MLKPVSYYGCVRCQVQHFEDTDAELYKAHIMWQSKHGVKDFHESIEDRAARYGIAMGDNAGLLEAYRELNVRIGRLEE
jgi:hypothetical protein